MATRLINMESSYSALQLLIDERMLRHIVRCTEMEGKRVLGEWSLSPNELEIFIALCYVRGALGCKNIPLRSLWSEKWGIQIFKDSMPRTKFEEILRFIHFDIRTERRERLETDKFALISTIWDQFIDNCKKLYVPDWQVCVDEQLFPTKSRCRFTQYMAKKPHKFGIKFWLLAEVQSKYLCNGKPYLGKDETRPQGTNLSSHVVLDLMSGLTKRGYNVTCDNFFTSLQLCKTLKEQNTSLLGTLRSNRREVPPSVINDMNNKKVPVGITQVFEAERGITLTAYKAKPTKTVLLLSSLHSSVSVSDGGKRKPDTVLDYNATKFGVDCLDQMACQYSTKAATRRWPVAVFFNILDLAGVNAWILYKKVSLPALSIIFLVF